MAPLRPPLAQSESKSRFFERLCFDEKSESHRRLYSMMKEEAVEARRRVTMNTESLAPHYQNDASVEPPYSSSQISETAFHREILKIYRHARPETKQIYDLGRDVDRVEENWIIRWMLWHVFRYRDNRNKNRGIASSSDGKPGGDQADNPDETHTEPRQSGEGPSRQTRYWDPVRDD